MLDIGCLEETSLDKEGTDEWLRRLIAAVAYKVTGIDSSERLSDGEIVTGSNSRIVKGDGTDPDPAIVDADQIAMLVAGEFIEHIENPMAFLRNMARRFPGRKLILSMPNGATFANALLGTIGREAQHPDHLLISTYKTLNTLCLRAGFFDVADHSLPFLRNRDAAAVAWTKIASRPGDGSVCTVGWASVSIAQLWLRGHNSALRRNRAAMLCGAR